MEKNQRAVDKTAETQGNIIFTPEDKSGIIVCKAVQRREGRQNERTIAV